MPKKVKKNVALESLPKEMNFHWIKTGSFRAIHVDGAFGGISPRGDQIQMAIYSERWPIPRQTTHSIAGGVTIRSEIEAKRIQKEGIVRDIEASLVFNVDTARNIVKWLNEKIKTIEQREQKILENAVSELVKKKPKVRRKIKGIAKSKKKSIKRKEGTR